RAALARPILVLPVLVAGARMPQSEQLPEDVKAITTKTLLHFVTGVFMMIQRTSLERALILRQRKEPGEARAHSGQRSHTGSVEQLLLWPLSSPSRSCTFRYWLVRCQSRLEKPVLCWC